MATQTLRINIYEYRHDFIRPLWDHLFAEFKTAFPGVSVEVAVDPEGASTADIIWASNRRDMKTLSIDAFSQSPEAQAALARCCPEKEYFVAAWNDLQRTGRAGCPFSISAGITLWNNRLLAADRARTALIPKGGIDFFCRSKDSPGRQHAPLIGYLCVPFVLMQLVSGGMLHYDRERGLSRFKRPEIAEFLAFNRAMFLAAKQINGGVPIMDIREGMNLFLSADILALSTFSPTLQTIPENRIRDFSVSTTLLGSYAPAVPVYLGIGAQCRDVPAAATAIAFFCGRQGQQILAQHHNNIPARLENACAKEFLEHSPHNMKQVIAALRTADDVIDLNHFFSEETGICGRIGRYILGESELSEVFS